MVLERDGQHEVDGLLMGPGTKYVVDKVFGMGVPEIKVVDRDLPDQDGGYAGTDYLGPREIVMEVGLDGEQDEVSYDETITELGRVFAPRAAAVAYRWQRFGRVRRLLARPRGFVLPWDDDFHLGAGRAAIRLIAHDPTVYSDEEASSGPTSGSFNVTNEGNYVVWPTVTTAAGGDVTLTNATTGESVVLADLTGAAVIDFKTKTVDVGGLDEYGAVEANPDWWMLQPGLNALEFSASSTITWRHGWTTG